MHKGIYSLLLVTVVFAGFWIFNPDDKGTAQEGAVQKSNELSVRPWAVSNSSASQTNNEKSHNDQNSRPTEISEVADIYSEVNDGYCGDRCRESLELLRFQFELNDEERENLLGRAEEIAAYLRQNPDAQEELLEMASFAGADKRSVIMAVFEQLDLQARWSLGQVLIESHDWHSRFDGINFLSQPDLIDGQLTQQFLDLLVVDPNYYVRSNIIQAFGQTDIFYGNQEVLSALEQVGYSDPNYQVRGQALLTSAELLRDPQDIFSDALAAATSQKGDYQMYGLRTLDLILNKQTLETPPLTWANEQAAKNIFDELMESDYDDMPAENRQLADSIFERHFGG